MPIEIERKFLVADTSWRDQAADRQHLRQSYITSTDHVSVRVRIIDDVRATLTVKLPKSGMSRYEFEQDISVHEGLALLELAGREIIEKHRYPVEHAGSNWVIDDYLGDNQGLVVAELELPKESQVFVRPPWLGREVTGVECYQNSSLVRRPYLSWPEQGSLRETA